MSYRSLLTALLLSPSLSANATSDYFLDNLFFELGVWFGGEKVADNPDGDNYNAGGGAILGLGYSYQPESLPFIESRNLLAYRTQGSKSGQGSNSGMVFESVIVKTWPHLNFGLGAGLHVDLMNEVSDYYGNKTKFDNSLGPVVHLEIMAGETLSFLFKYLATDYTATTGRVYDGNQFGLTLLAKY